MMPELVARAPVATRAPGRSGATHSRTRAEHGDVAILCDAERQPYADAFRCGFGDGIYYRDELFADGDLVGWRIAFVGEQDPA